MNLIDNKFIAQETEPVLFLGVEKEETVYLANLDASDSSTFTYPHLEYEFVMSSTFNVYER